MIATRVKDYLDQHQVAYGIVQHPVTGSSIQSAQSAHVPGAQLAKAVVLEDDHGPLVAVLPADFHLDLGLLRHALQRPLDFADEDELPRLFPDCDPGAVPALGLAYGVPTIWDTELGKEDLVFFEGGDHTSLVKLSGRAFHELMTPAQRGRFSHHA